jgi:hypothetical protein
MFDYQELLIITSLIYMESFREGFGADRAILKLGNKVQDLIEDIEKEKYPEDRNPQGT